MNQNTNQYTIIEPVAIEGKGLHTGNFAKVVFKPAAPNSGIVFKRADLPEAPLIPAKIDHVVEVFRGTALGLGAAKVHTVEHVVSAVFGLGISNILIEIQGEEPPACDGSAKPFADALQRAGKAAQPFPAETCSLSEPFWIEESDRFIGYLPSDKFEISYSLEYANSIIPKQTITLCIDEANYLNRICSARTFGFIHEYEMLKAKGLALGSSFDNSLVIAPDGSLMNSCGTRDDKEFALHKILDLTGDLGLIGRRVKGRIIAHKTGHSFNVRFARRLCELFAAEQERKAQKSMNIEEIKQILPHRYPFLLIDKIISLEPGKSIIGIKNVTANEEFFTGHYPERSMMPGVLIVEAMAQAAGVLFLSQPEHKGKLPFFVGIDKIRFRRPVVPGDRLQIFVTVIKIRGNTGKVAVEAQVEGERVCSGELMFTIV